ncbi:hypothetical protein JCM10450v2_002734 [Rhodotorula kratochvilovae]
MDWDEAGRLFLPIPWSSFDDLLLKVLYDKSGRLSLMATDLENVYFESLTQRQVNRRVEDALGTLASEGGSQSQGVMVGIGEDGERLLQESVDALIGAVSDGSARVAISHEAFEHIISISLPGSFTMRFLASSLEHQSASALASHLVTPLLGVCSSLLALLREQSTDDAALLQRVEKAIDGSGTAERMDEGRAGRRFMSVGGPALLGRWVQRSLGAKEKDLQPVTLSLPSRPARPFSPSQPAPAPSRSQQQTKRKPSGSPPSPPARKAAHAHASPSASPSPQKPSGSIAGRMLDYRTGGGERVGWDDSQPATGAAAAGAAKGKGRAMDVEEPAPSPSSGDGSASQTATETQLSIPPPQQLRQLQEEEHLPAQAGDTTVEDEPTTDEEPAPSSRAALSPPPPSASASQPPAAPSPSPLAAAAAEDAREAKKRTTREEEKERELAKRRERLEKLKAAKGGAGVKKKVKKL